MLPLELPGNWLLCCSWVLVTPDTQTLREETKRLTAFPAHGFAPQTTITVADFILLVSAAPTNGAAEAVLQQCIAGTAGTQEEFDRLRYCLALIKTGLQKPAGFPKNRFSPESMAARLASPLVLTPAATYPKILTQAQQAKVNATRDQAEAARPGEVIFMQRSV
jgi:hypothetical protein